jgi:hypothetical protein
MAAFPDHSDEKQLPVLLEIIFFMMWQAGRYIRNTEIGHPLFHI